MNSPTLFSAIILTLFPEMFPGPLGQTLAGKALEKGIWSLKTLQIRDFATDKHKTVDAPSYGGGTGMVMKPEVLDVAIEHAKTLFPTTSHQPPTTIIYPSPRGIPITQPLIEKLKNEQLIILCGRFEGVDQRIIDHHNMLEVSLGDFIISGGEIAALAIMDACVRLLPGVIGKEDALSQESFASASEFARLLEYPHYTRPSFWNDRSVPEVLLSGNHAEISAWRLEQAKLITAARRPDLIKKEKE
ncbi:MAG: tRNA (guanosine(37)-N1)-methyltransferase TrmD [Pseudomonadota bacterium]